MAILNELKDNTNLSNIRMLDIGIGGGRTTELFYPLVKLYVGIDYAAKMLEVCRTKFKEARNCYFFEASVCQMNMFKDDTFDFVLFSFNGLDYNSHDERFTGLAEVHRVLKPNGFFCFSTHNINWIDIYTSFDFSSIRQADNLYKYPCFLIGDLIRSFRIRLANKSFSLKRIIDEIKKRGYGTFYDGPFGCKLKNYYTSHENQIKQLTDLYYKDIKSYAVDGNETTNDNDLKKGPWIYYLARK